MRQIDSTEPMVTIDAETWGHHQYDGSSVQPGKDQGV